MLVLFEIIKLLFLLFSILLGILIIKGESLFPQGNVADMTTILFPAYLVFVGLLVGYILALMISKNTDSAEQSHSLYMRTFMVGMIL